MIEIRNLTNDRIPRKKLQTLARNVLKKERREGKDLSVVFVGAARMRQLNRVWLSKDKAANVLAFPGGTFSLGEIVLCPSAIAKDAVQYHIPFERALSWMLVHGLLHLLGYGHETKKEEDTMTQKEQRYLSAL